MRKYNHFQVFADRTIFDHGQKETSNLLQDLGFRLQWSGDYLPNNLWNNPTLYTLNVKAYCIWPAPSISGPPYTAYWTNSTWYTGLSLLVHIAHITVNYHILETQNVIRDCSLQSESEHILLCTSVIYGCHNHLFYLQMFCSNLIHLHVKQFTAFLVTLYFTNCPEGSCHWQVTAFTIFFTQ